MKIFLANLCDFMMLLALKERPLLILLYGLMLFVHLKACLLVMFWSGYVLISFAREVSVFFVVAAKVVGKHAEIDVGIYAWLSVIYGTFVEEGLC